MGVADNADGIAAAFDAAGQLRVIGQHSSHPHQDGAVAMPVGMHPAAGLLTSDPLGRARMGGDLAVQRHSVFEHHIGPSGLDKMEKYRIDCPAFFLEDTGVDCNPMLPQDADAFARDLGVGVKRTNNHAGNAAFQNGIHARRLAAGVATGFEGNI